MRSGALVNWLGLAVVCMTQGACGGDEGKASGATSLDADGDGFTEADGDCDDADPLVSPASEESCDGIDNNCD
ncbi:MAG TPA: hypothetical protein DFR83_10305, partial [Deltaproteobacteria bacterium]|nr:hypothetical protein [Deltaproteobacteria bacterium]